jgi:hypothetical protein
VSCDKPEALVWPGSAAPGSNLNYEVDFTPALVNWHMRGVYYSSTARVRIPGIPGHEFECTTAGQTGTRPVLWPKTLAATVTDGSVTWTCRALSSDSLLDEVSGTPTWTVPTGITSSSTSVSDNVASGMLAVASSLDDGDYEVIVTASLTGGGTLPQSCILRVRRPDTTCPC